MRYAIGFYSESNSYAILQHNGLTGWDFYDPQTQNGADFGAVFAEGHNFGLWDTEATVVLIVA